MLSRLPAAGRIRERKKTITEYWDHSAFFPGRIFNRSIIFLLSWNSQPANLSEIRQLFFASAVRKTWKLIWLELLLLWWPEIEWADLLATGLLFKGLQCNDGHVYRPSQLHKHRNTFLPSFPINGHTFFARLSNEFSFHRFFFTIWHLHFKRSFSVCVWIRLEGSCCSSTILTLVGF